MALTIQSAVYTSLADFSKDGEKGANVTEKLQSMVDSETNTITFEEGQEFNDLFGDPEPFHPKILRVKFTVDDVEYKKSILECVAARRTICAQDSAPIQEEETKEEPEPGLEVEHAWYGGIQGSQKDVTEQLREMIDPITNLISIPKSVKFNSFFGGDPAPFASKQLKVQFKLKGKELLEAIIPEKRDKDYTVPEGVPVPA